MSISPNRRRDIKQTPPTQLGTGKLNPLGNNRLSTRGSITTIPIGTITPDTLGKTNLTQNNNGFKIGNSSIAQNYASEINSVDKIKAENTGKQASMSGPTTVKSTIENFNSNAGTNVASSYSADINKTTDSTSKNDAYWNDLYNEIKTNTLNSKNEVAMAQRKAGANMENYLKMLGIQGTGLGQSQYASLASDYANKIADINANEQNAILDLKGEQKAEQDRLAEEAKAEAKENQKQFVNNAIALIENNGDASAIIAELESQGYDTTFLKEYARTIADDFAEKEQDELTTENKKQIANIMSQAETLISYGQDPSALISQLVELGASQADIDYINSLYNAYKEEKATAEADELEASNKELADNVYDLYDELKDNINSFTGSERAEIESTLAEANIALRNKDYESLEEIYDRLINASLGNGELNIGTDKVDSSTYNPGGAKTNLLDPDTKYVSEMSPEDFTRNGKLKDKEEKVLEYFLTDLKNGKLESGVYEVGYGSWNAWFQYDKETGTLKRVNKQAFNDATYKKHLKDDLYTYEKGIVTRNYD